MRQTVASITTVIQLGAVVIAATLLPLLVGIWLDSTLHTAPWITLIALVVGVVGAMAAVYKTITNLYRQSG